MTRPTRSRTSCCCSRTRRPPMPNWCWQRPQVSPTVHARRRPRDATTRPSRFASLADVLAGLLGAKTADDPVGARTAEQPETQPPLAAPMSNPAVAAAAVPDDPASLDHASKGGAPAAIAPTTSPLSTAAARNLHLPSWPDARATAIPKLHNLTRSRAIRRTPSHRRPHRPNRRDRIRSPHCWRRWSNRSPQIVRQRLKNPIRSRTSCCCCQTHRPPMQSWSWRHPRISRTARVKRRLRGAALRLFALPRWQTF